MSAPTDDWREAGLAEPDELDPANPLLAEPSDDDRGEDYHPAAARPDLNDDADEADVVEQAYEVGTSDDDEGEPDEN